MKRSKIKEVIDFNLVKGWAILDGLFSMIFHYLIKRTYFEIGFHTKYMEAGTECPKHDKTMSPSVSAWCTNANYYFRIEYTFIVKDAI